jgi:hypothetical protein
MAIEFDPTLDDFAPSPSAGAGPVTTSIAWSSIHLVPMGAGNLSADDGDTIPGDELGEDHEVDLGYQIRQALESSQGATISRHSMRDHGGPA